MIGVGNELCGDDAAGIAVVRRLRDTTDLDTRELQGEPTGLLDAWQGRAAVVLVDTMRSGAPPGAICRIDVGRTRLPSGLVRSTSTHAVGLGETLELARAIGRLPGRVVVYAIEGRRFEVGAPMSDAVRSGIDELAARVASELRPLRQSGLSAAATPMQVARRGAGRGGPNDREFGRRMGAATRSGPPRRQLTRLPKARMWPSGSWTRNSRRP